MKSIAQLKEQIYDEVMASGQFHNVQAQLKAQVYQLIEREYGKTKIGFQYQHPQLSKLKKYPLTSYCMDLIQQFLESFKFKHTLNVFKKEINRNVSINRSHLAQSFRIEIKNPESQAVLLSMVQQMVTGDVGAVKNEPKINNFVETKASDRTNNFIDDSSKNNDKKYEPPQKPAEPSFKKQPPSNSNSNSNISNSNVDSSLNSNSNSANIPKSVQDDTSSAKIDSSFSKDISKEEPSKVQEPPKVEEDSKKKGGKGQNKKPVVEKEKPPEGAKDLLGDVMKKFEPAIKAKDKEQEKKELFQAKRAFSEEKQKKALDQAESGANKIRGISMGKTVPSFMNKFMAQQPVKNESYIDEQLDQFQQSKDSTRKNPLFSSTQSGFEKSGFDYSVDSSAIQEYEYTQRAKKLSKKL